MEPSTTPGHVWTGYVALSTADNHAFADIGELRPEIFDYPGVCGQFIPLDMTVEDAVETALLQCTSAVFEVTHSETTWHVFKLTFAGQVVTDMWSSGKLRWSESRYRLDGAHPGGKLQWSATRYRMEFRSPIKAEWLFHKTGASPEVEVTEVTLPQMYYDDWGDRVLSAQWSLQKSKGKARCETCACSSHFTWTAEQSYGGGTFCAECWHAYCKKGGYIRDCLHGCQPKAMPWFSGSRSSDEQDCEVEAGSSEGSGSPTWELLEGTGSTR